MVRVLAVMELQAFRRHTRNLKLVKPSGVRHQPKSGVEETTPSPMSAHSCRSHCLSLPFTIARHADESHFIAMTMNCVISPRPEPHLTISSAALRPKQYHRTRGSLRQERIWRASDERTLYPSVTWYLQSNPTLRAKLHSFLWPGLPNLSNLHRQ